MITLKIETLTECVNVYSSKSRRVVMVIIEDSLDSTWSTIPCTARFTLRTFTALPSRMSPSTSLATFTDCAYVRLAAVSFSSSSWGPRPPSGNEPGCSHRGIRQAIDEALEGGHVRARLAEQHRDERRPLGPLHARVDLHRADAVRVQRARERAEGGEVGQVEAQACLVQEEEVADHAHLAPPSAWTTLSTSACSSRAPAARSRSPRGRA
jgi:hypothetical protein